MTTSRAIKPPRREDNLLTGWESVPEVAPSIVRQDQPTVARVLALIGLFLILLGLIPFVGPLVRLQNTVLSPGLGFLSTSIGLMLVFFHAFVDAERVFRRLYAGIGLAAVAAAIILRIWPAREGTHNIWGAYFGLYGFPALTVGLIMLVATVRQETEKTFRNIMVWVLGGVGGVMLVGSVGIGLFTRYAFLPGEGGVHLILGLLFVCAYIGQEENPDLSHYAALGLGALGLLAFAGGLTRSLIPESIFLVPSGLILMGAGIIYMAVSAGICLDWPIFVLTRRELSAYFYSPIGYLVLIGSIIVGWYMFVQFLLILADPDPRFPNFEPIVLPYIFGIIPVLVQMIMVPVLTMRLLAEEKRTGTLEVLLTAPVNEVTVVMSKFLAAWFFYMLTWVPWWLNLIALRYWGGDEFDYRPLLSFNIGLLAISAGFVSMGLFFSSLTSNQIIAAVLAVVGMIAHLGAYLIRFQARLTPGSGWYELLNYVSYLDLWLNTLEGRFAPRFLMFHISAAAFFLYATVKVLEARKWK